MLDGCGLGAQHQDFDYDMKGGEGGESGRGKRRWRDGRIFGVGWVDVY
jgi:hypothetical protein